MMPQHGLDAGERTGMVAAGEEGLTMIVSSAVRERELRAEASAEAVALFRERGAGAVEFLTHRMALPGVSAADRRRDRLARLEVERLDREQRNGSSAVELVVWKPPLFSFAGIASRLGLSGRFRRRHR